MGGSSSTLNFANIKLTERECRAATRDLFDAQAFEQYADADNMISLEALNAIYGQKCDVFISHDWQGGDVQRRIFALNDGLRARGLKTWIDSDRYGEDMRKKMTQAIENASCVVVCVTKTYVDLVNSSDTVENFPYAFKQALRKKEAGRMVGVILENSMKDSRTWVGEVGMVLGGSEAVNLSDDAATERQLDALYGRVCTVAGVTVGQVLQDRIWKDLIEKKLRSAASMVTSMLAAAAVSDATDAPSAAAIAEPLPSSAAAQVQAALQSELEAWIFQHTKIVPKFVEQYVSLLVQAGIGSVDKLRKRLGRNPSYLLDLGVDEDDAEELCAAIQSTDKSLVKVFGVSPKDRDFKDLYCWYINARTLGHAGKEDLMAAAADLSDLDRAMMAKTMLAVALNGGGGSFSKNLPMSLDHAQEVLPWLRERSAPATDEETTLSQRDQRPYALPVLCAAFLAYLIRDGIGTARDEYTAVRFMKAAAPHGLSLALFLLGFATKMGKGTIRDKSKGVEYYRLAAAQGFPMALVNIGVSYYNGEGVEKDFGEAVHYFRIAADKGHARGLFELGTMYYNGEGVAQDYAEAARLFTRSHDRGYPAATYYLALCHLNGQGVSRDRDRGRQLMQEASEHGDDDAKAFLSRAM